MKYTLLVFLILITSLSFSQEFNFENVRYIEVVGSAEREIIPDEILIQVDLKERMEGRNKFDLRSIEAKFNAIVNSVGIDKSKVLLSEAGSNYISIKRRRGDVFATKRYIVEVNNFKIANQFIDELKDASIIHSIKSKSHSKMTEYRKDTKIAALQAAKAKAMYLVTSVDASLGKVLHIEEIENSSYNYTRGVNSSNSAYSNSFCSVTLSSENFTPITMRFEIRVVFEIVD
jgi:uncharacterized protein YggE